MWLIATGSSESVRARSGTEVTGRLKVGATRWRERSAAALLQLILQRGDCLLGAGLVEMAARRTGHANRTKGFIAGLQRCEDRPHRHAPWPAARPSGPHRGADVVAVGAAGRHGLLGQLHGAGAGNAAGGGGRCSCAAGSSKVWPLRRRSPQPSGRTLSSSKWEESIRTQSQPSGSAIFLRKR